ncbi:MAG: Xaa-Pro peptidase family protein [Bryobacteraceae bacterium]
MTRANDARAGRRSRLADILGELRCDAAVISHLPNVRYLSGFTGSNGLLFLQPHAATLFTDPRYELQAREEADCSVRVVPGSTWEALWKFAARRARRIAVETDRIPHQVWAQAAETLGRRVKLLSLNGAVERLRRIKSAAEADAIRASARLCAQAFRQAVRRFRPGMTENEAAAEIEYRMRRLGASAPAFETIVAAGARAALPHARPGSVKLAAGQPVLIDMGANLDGYMSDMTRMVCLGAPPRKFLRLYKAVLEAQQAALEAIRPAVEARKVDAAARRVLQKHGLDRFFTHSTGHGVGLEIHEAPRVGAKSGDVLEEGMVVTVEPGIYLEGEAGIRIEDTVLITAAGAEILTPVPKELMVLES